MHATIRIVGQGIAGSLLAWACERKGIECEIIDRGHAEAASRMGAGLVSPLTGQRLVPTWRFPEWAERARGLYGELEAELGLALVRPMRLRRLYRTAQQRERMEAKLGVPEVAAWVESADAQGLWLRGAFQVDTARLIAGLRQRWLGKGWLTERSVDGDEPSARATIWCVGAGVQETDLAAAKWELSKGEILTGRLVGLKEDVLLNDGQWVLPIGSESVRVGATFNRNDLRLVPSAAAEIELRAAAERLGGRPIESGEMGVGLRVNVADRRPVVGWRDDAKRWGIFAGLAAKGALWAPILAEQWAADGLMGGALEGEVSPARFQK